MYLYVVMYILAAFVNMYVAGVIIMVRPWKFWGIHTNFQSVAYMTREHGHLYYTIP